MRLPQTNRQRFAKPDCARRQPRDWENWGICDYITKPRIVAAITGKTPDGEGIEDEYKFTDEFPMADGFEENAEFFTLQGPMNAHIAVQLPDQAFARIAPSALAARRGKRGTGIEKVPGSPAGWEVANAYGLLVEPG